MAGVAVELLREGSVVSLAVVVEVSMVTTRAASLMMVIPRMSEK